MFGPLRATLSIGKYTCLQSIHRDLNRTYLHNRRLYSLRVQCSSRLLGKHGSSTLVCLVFGGIDTDMQSQHVFVVFDHNPYTGLRVQCSWRLLGKHGSSTLGQSRFWRHRHTPAFGTRLSRHRFKP